MRLFKGNQGDQTGSGESKAAKTKQRKRCTGKCNGNGDYYTQDVKPSGGYRECTTCGGTGYIYE